MAAQDGTAELTSGEFARASGLSAKALRLYAENGLLRPARVDPATGYRYYAPSQVERARAVVLLRRLDLPLARIRELLDSDPESFARQVRGWWEHQIGTVTERRDAVDLLVETFGAGGSPSAPRASGPGLPVIGPDDVRVRDVAARVVATTTLRLTQEELVAGFTGAVLLIRAHLTAAGVELGHEYWVLFHGAVRPGRAAEVEVCVPYDGLVAPTEEITLRVEPAHREAYVDVTAQDCRYPRIMAAYDAVSAWVARAARPAGVVREVYAVPWSQTGVVASIAQPIA